MGLARSALQYRAAPKDDEALRLAMIRSANHGKVERLWREEGQQLPKGHKKRKRLYHKDSSIIRLRPQHEVVRLD